MRRIGPAGGSVAIAWLVLRVSSSAAEGVEEVSLDQLLKLPDSYNAAIEERRAGASAVEWRLRFSEARQQLSASHQALSETQRRLESAAGDSSTWQAGAPGLASDPNESPMNFGLREKLREQREGVAQAERNLRDLEVEANLARVPEEWRGPARSSSPPSVVE